MVVFDALFAGGKGLRFTADYPAPTRHAAGPRPRGLRRGDAGRHRLAGLALPVRLHRHRGRSRGAEGAARPSAEAERAVFAALEEAGRRAWTADGGHGGVPSARRRVRRRPRRPARARAPARVLRGLRRPSAPPGSARAGRRRHRRRRPAVRPRAARSRARHRRLVRPVGTGEPEPPAPSPAGSALGRWPASPTAAATAAPTTAVLANGVTLIVAPGAGPLVALKGRLRPAAPPSVLRRCSPSPPSCCPPATPPRTRCLSSGPCTTIPPPPSTRTRSNSAPPSSATTWWACCGRWARGSRASRRAFPSPSGGARLRRRGRAPSSWKQDVDARLSAAVRNGLNVRAAPPWGAVADFDRVAPGDLRAFAAAALGPAQATLAVAGAADAPAVRAVVEGWSCAIGGARPLARSRRGPSWAGRLDGIDPRDPGEAAERPRGRIPRRRGPAVGRRRHPAHPLSPRGDGIRRAAGQGARRSRSRVLGERDARRRRVDAPRPGAHRGVRRGHVRGPGPHPAHPRRRGEGAFTAAELAEAQAYLRGKRARSRDGSVATAAALVEEAAEAPPDTDAVTLAQLNDTARRLFSRGAPLAVIAGAVPRRAS